MALSERINIALCFSNENDARSLSKKLTEIAPDINFITGADHNGFLKAIGSADKIDCFIIEEKYRECSSVELVEQLKNNLKYKKSVIAVFSANIKNIDTRFYELHTDYIFDLSFELKSVITSLRHQLMKNILPVIPKSFNVLVLENSPDILELISLHLDVLGHDQFDPCMDVKEARQKLAKNDYDLLLLDWNLDDGTCLDVIEFIKNQPVSQRTKSAVTVVITGRDEVEDIMTLLAYGIQDHIIKPFGLQEFEDKIRYALEKNIKHD